MYEQSFSFTFEAAHELGALADGGPDHPYARVHGHSFAVTVTIGSAHLPNDRWIMDFAALKGLCEEVRKHLDHAFLNAIEGLETPTLETIARWIHGRLAMDVPGQLRVEIARPSLGERIAYWSQG